MKNTVTEERILRETGTMFFRHGIRTITMDDIAANLGISKKTIYHYYQDKAELVRTFTDNALKNQELRMSDIRKSSNDPIHEMLNLMEHLENFFTQVNPTVFYDLQKYHPQSWNDFKIFKEKVLVGNIEDNLKRGMQQDLYRKELKIKILARLRIEELEIGFNPLVFAPESFKMSDVQLTLIDHFLHGIITMKGFRLIDKYRKSTRKK